MKRIAFIAAMAACGAFAAEEPNDWENPAVNSINRLPARTYAMPLADEASALTDALEPATPYAMSLNGDWKFNWVGDSAATLPALSKLTGKHALFFVFSSETKEKSLCTLQDFQFK